MNTPRTSPISDSQKFEAMSLEDKQAHIASWFIDTDHPIENKKGIFNPEIVGDSISFWYENRLRNCFLRPREETDDDISFQERESCGADILSLSVTQKIRAFVPERQGNTAIID